MKLLGNRKPDGPFKLHHIRRGTGEPLLLIQGMSGTHLAWGDPFLDDLARDFDVVAYDHRGIGLSPKTKDPFSIKDLAEDAVGLLDELGWASAHVVGISMGGMVAQELALAHPERIRTLGLGCTYCGGEGAMLPGPEVMQGLGEGMQSGDFDVALRAMWRFNVSAAFAGVEENFQAFRAMATGAPAKAQVIMLQMQAIAQHDTNARLPTLDLPTLVVHGTADQMLPSPNGELIASLIPGARLELLEGVGHLWWWEQPARAATLVRDHARSAAAH